jgi:hypothetical protein
MEWRDFLRGYSDDFVRVATEEQLARLDETQRRTRWLGYAPAREKAVTAAEERLGVRLPPSYRGFLLASNGWRNISVLLDELRTVDGIGWVTETDLELWDFVDEDDDEMEKLLGRALLISGPADGDYWFLDPHDVGPGGEWAAYEWPASSGEQPQRFPSFGALVARARMVFADRSGREGRPVNPEGADHLLAAGRRMALAGEVDEALDAFDAAHARGSALAPYLSGLLRCFTEPGAAAESYIRTTVLGDRLRKAVDDLHLRAELIPLYLDVWRDGAPAHPAYYARRFAEYLPRTDQDTDTGDDREVLAARAARYVPPVLPEAPEFQRALDNARRLIAAGDHVVAWEVIQRALPLWRSDSFYRIAPVILRVDPVFRPVVTPDRYRTIVTTPRPR